MSPNPLVSPALMSLMSLSLALVASVESPHAVSWISYVPGGGVPPSYQSPSSALGEPARYSGIGVDPGVVSPFHPAFLPGEVVSIGPGGSLVLAFDHDVLDDPANPFGVDLIVFGNSFFADLEHPFGTCGVLYAEGGVIDVSENGSIWHTVPGVVADGLFPTLGWLDAGPYDLVPGSVPSDFTRPVDPVMAPLLSIGTTWPTLLSMYDGSGGGAGVDLASVGLAKARFLRIRVPAGAGFTAEIDAVSDVAAVMPVAPGDLNGDGIVNGADLGLLLAAWGGAGGGSGADIDGSGTVDGADLAILLGHWSGA